MSGVITSSSFAKLLWPGLNSIYGKEYSDYPVEWDKLFEKNTSDRAYEEDVGLSSFGLASVNVFQYTWTPTGVLLPVGARVRDSFSS